MVCAAPRAEARRRGACGLGLMCIKHFERLSASSASAAPDRCFDAGGAAGPKKPPGPGGALAVVAVPETWPGQLKKFFSRSVQLSPLGEWREPPFLSDSSSSRSSLRWCSVSLTGVSTTMWQYRSPG